MSTAAVSPPGPRRDWIRGSAELLLTVALAVGGALLIQSFLVRPYKIPTGSMIPTLKPGQRILVDRLSTHPKLGEIVVFHPPAGAETAAGSQCGDPVQGPRQAQPCDRATAARAGATYVKRVVGLPGDTLRISRGVVYRNGVRETGSYIQPCPDPSRCTFVGTITVPRGEYYMMGDNRDVSDDSRYWGPIPQRWIVGRAVASYWPPDRIGTL